MSDPSPSAMAVDDNNDNAAAVEQQPPTESADVDMDSSQHDQDALDALADLAGSARPADEQASLNVPPKGAYPSSVLSSELSEDSLEDAPAGAAHTDGRKDDDEEDDRFGDNQEESAAGHLAEQNRPDAEIAGSIGPDASTSKTFGGDHDDPTQDESDISDLSSADEDDEDHGAESESEVHRDDAKAEQDREDDSDSESSITSSTEPLPDRISASGGEQRDNSGRHQGLRGDDGTDGTDGDDEDEEDEDGDGEGDVDEEAEKDPESAVQGSVESKQVESTKRLEPPADDGLSDIDPPRRLQVSRRISTKENARKERDSKNESGSDLDDLSDLTEDFEDDDAAEGKARQQQRSQPGEDPSESVKESAQDNGRPTADDEELDETGSQISDISQDTVNPDAATNGSTYGAAPGSSNGRVDTTVPVLGDPNEALQARIRQERQRRALVASDHEDDADSLDEMLAEDRRAARGEGRHPETSRPEDEPESDFSDDEQQPGGAHKDVAAMKGPSLGPPSRSRPLFDGDEDEPMTDLDDDDTVESSDPKKPRKTNNAHAGEDAEEDDDPELDDEIHAAKAKYKTEARRQPMLAPEDQDREQPDDEAEQADSDHAEDAEDDVERDGKDDEEDEAKKLSGTPSPAPEKPAHVSTLSSAPNAPTIQAMQALTAIEIKFAALRDQLYIERMEELAREEAVIIEGSHPSLKLLHETLTERRDNLLRLAELRLQLAEKDMTSARTADRQAVWSWWHDAKSKLIEGEYIDNARKKREIEREAAEFVVAKPPLKALPPKDPGPSDWLSRNFLWNQGSSISPLPGQDIMNDLAQMGIGVRQFYRYGPPMAPFGPPQPNGQGGPYGRSVHGSGDDVLLVDHQGMPFHPAELQGTGGPRRAFPAANGQTAQTGFGTARHRNTSFGAESRPLQGLAGPGQGSGMPPPFPQPPRTQGRTVPTHTADPFALTKPHRSQEEVLLGGKSSKAGGHTGKGRRSDIAGEDASASKRSKKSAMSGEVFGSGSGMGAGSLGASQGGSLDGLATGPRSNGMSHSGKGLGRPPSTGTNDLDSGKLSRRSPSPRRTVLQGRSNGPTSHPSGPSPMHGRFGTPTSLLSQTMANPVGSSGSTIASSEWTNGPPIPSNRTMNAGSLRPADLADHRSRVLNG